MTLKFSGVLETILRRGDPRPTKQPSAPLPAEQAASIALHQRQEWFAKFATSDIMPLLDEAAAAARRHGAAATSRLVEGNEHLAAELEISRGGLPTGARSPRLTVYPTGGDRPLMIEFTGTFPHVGATGGFGAEVDFDAIYPSQLEEKILDFVALANGVGAPLR